MYILIAYFMLDSNMGPLDKEMILLSQVQLGSSSTVFLICPTLVYGIILRLILFFFEKIQPTKLYSILQIYLFLKKIPTCKIIPSCRFIESGEIFHSTELFHPAQLLNLEKFAILQNYSIL